MDSWVLDSSSLLIVFSEATWPHCPSLFLLHLDLALSSSASLMVVVTALYGHRLIWSTPYMAFSKSAKLKSGTRFDLAHLLLGQSIYLLARLLALSACFPVCLCDCLFVCLSVCLTVCLPACLPVCLPACLPASMQPCLPVCLCLSGFLTV